jgi:3-hydroxyacyl-CoA dehydrogenase/enoyl-CoA hydratase/3-hydroxybutyryl-CoA epimerase/3-hydroxyacyl-CoA dehydrogenase/enoyl-CoA hydratase/3-hydroxybutyryl-CoA epimerase/enoyl-CoA isomerase
MSITSKGTDRAMTRAFRFEIVQESIGKLTFDLPESKVNTLSGAVIVELEEYVGQLEKRPDLRGLLLASGKPDQFIAGADLRELAALARLTREQAVSLLTRGHQLFGRISRLPFPTVALVDGVCLGGGTELVLSMDYRIVSTNPKTEIGLPEVKIGIIPGWGGTQRLPRLVGVPNAIEIICSGEPVGPQRAVAVGLAFDAVPVDRLVVEGCRLIEFAQSSGQWRDERKRREQPVGLTEDQTRFAFAVAEAEIRSKTKGQNPAPLVALKAIQEGCNLPLEAGLQAELRASLEVVGSETSNNLIAVFFMTKRLERDPGVSDPAVRPREVRRVGVLGAGLMGSGIAAACARRGIPSVMIDLDEARVAAGLARARQVVAARIKIGRAAPDDLPDMLSRISTGTDLAAVAGADVIIEAVTENESAKSALYTELMPMIGPDAILASNTSTISITRLADAVACPERFCGMHFFNPVDRMALVEVIRGEKTNDATTAAIVALAKRIGKTPIVVRDCPGFLVNRVLFPYMTESLLLLLEGAASDMVDDAATRFGMPMGPILLHDVVGLDTAWFAGNVIHQAYPDRAVKVELLGDLVRSGRLGQKSGAGFRRYDARSLKGKPDPDLDAFLEKHRTAKRPFTPEELTNRLFLPMLLEATRVLEESIVREPADVDMGLILGVGFPPVRGGILRWCDRIGADTVCRTLEQYRPLGQRFVPTESLERLARTGGKWYPGS